MGYPSCGTPLLRAIKRGKVDAVRFLLENGACLMKTTAARGLTALELARKKGVLDEIREMVEEVSRRRDNELMN